MKHIHRKRKTRAPDDVPQNEYYENVSAKLGIVQVVLYFSLFAFVVLSFVRNTNLITYRNFYYFFKDLDASAEKIDVLHSDSVSYPTSSSQSFTLYRGGLAVAGNTAVTVFTATGRQTVSQTVSYQNPVARGAGKYLLVYELGGTQYSLYNSYTQVYSGKSDHPINGAAVSDSGMYALLSSSETYTSVVNLYSSNFSLINRYEKNGYVMDLSLNEKGSMLALLVADANGSAFRSHIELYRPREDSLHASLELGDGLAFSAAFTSSGNVAVVCGSAVLYVTSEGKLLSSHDFAGYTPISVDLGKDGAAICLQETEISEQNRIIVFDKDGEMLYNEDVPVKVQEISRSEKTVYLKCLGSIRRLYVSDGSVSEVFCHTEQRRILAVNETEVLLCTPQKAEYIRYGSL